MYLGILVSVNIADTFMSIPFLICSGNHRRWVDSGMLVILIMLMTSMSILNTALAIIACEFCILAYWWLWSYWWSHVHFYPALAIIGSELYILACWRSCWWFYVHSSSYSGNHSLWVVHSDMLITVILFMIPYPYHSSFYSGNHSLWVLYLIYPWLWWCWWFYVHSLHCFGNHSG